MADERDPNDPDGTQAVDVDDVDLSVTPSSERGNTGPPPLPPEVRASAAPPPLHTPSMAPSMPPPAAGRSNAFYIGLLVAFVVVGIGAGIVIARNTKAKETPPAVSVSIQTAAPPAGSVMTLPTIDMSDEDGGK